MENMYIQIYMEKKKNLFPESKRLSTASDLSSFFSIW